MIIKKFIDKSLRTDKSNKAMGSLMRPKLLNMLNFIIEWDYIDLPEGADIGLKVGDVFQIQNCLLGVQSESELVLMFTDSGPKALDRLWEDSIQPEIDLLSESPYDSENVKVTWSQMTSDLIPAGFKKQVLPFGLYRVFKEKMLQGRHFPENWAILIKYTNPDFFIDIPLWFKNDGVYYSDTNEIVSDIIEDISVNALKHVWETLERLPDTPEEAETEDEEGNPLAGLFGEKSDDDEDDDLSNLLSDLYGGGDDGDDKKIKIRGAFAPLITLFSYIWKWSYLLPSKIMKRTRHYTAFVDSDNETYLTVYRDHSHVTLWTSDLRRIYENSSASQSGFKNTAANWIYELVQDDKQFRCDLDRWMNYCRTDFNEAAAKIYNHIKRVIIPKEKKEAAVRKKEEAKKAALEKKKKSSSYQSKKKKILDLLGKALETSEKLEKEGFPQLAQPILNALSSVKRVL